MCYVIAKRYCEQFIVNQDNLDGVLFNRDFFRQSSKLDKNFFDFLLFQGSRNYSDRLHLAGERVQSGAPYL